MVILSSDGASRGGISMRVERSIIVSVDVPISMLGATDRNDVIGHVSMVEHGRHVTPVRRLHHG